MLIRPATDDDLPRVAAIYAEHVRTGTGSFEEVPPSPGEMAERHAVVVAAGCPWLVAERDGLLLGYAFAGPWKARSAYRFTVEDSVYVAPGHARRGIGSALLGRLIEDCTARGYRQLMAVTGDGENTGSVALHRRHGFRVVGTARGIGFKFGRWLDVVYLQRELAPPP